MRRELNAIITIAYRDWIMLLRDKTRLLASFVFPTIFVGILGISIQSSLGEKAGFNLLTFVYIGVLGQSLFQSTATGIISLAQDRVSDFSQEIFVSPISRYSIIIGKIIGESLVAFTQLGGILILGKLLNIPLDWSSLIKLIPAAAIICLLGGSFGILVVANLNSVRLANQIFTFLIFPQFFLAGVFTPVNNLPFPLMIASRVAPMTYAVDFVRGLYYLGEPEYSQVVLHHPFVNLAVIVLMIIVFITLGTALFIRNERNK